MGRLLTTGRLNSLAQLMIKITAPGIPDFYQGSELWDLRLVDPDNRGPVDFEKRVRLLAELQELEEKRGRLNLIQDVMEHWQDGRIKLFVISRALNFRRAHESLFLQGTYQPLAATGEKRENVFAFMRYAQGAWAITAVPRLATRLTPSGRLPTGKSAWGAGAVRVPPGAPTDWFNVLTGEKLQACGPKLKRYLPLAEVFSALPVALLAAF